MYSVAKEQKRVKMHLILSRQRGHEASLTLEEWLATLEIFQGMCAYCRLAPYYVLEHLTPTSHGGGTTAKNCVPACATCNARKLDRRLDLDISALSLEEVAHLIYTDVISARPRPFLFKRKPKVSKASVQHPPLPSLTHDELTPEEVADALSVNQETVYNRIRSGKLKARKEGKLYRIRKSDFEAYVQSTWDTSEEGR